MCSIYSPAHTTNENIPQCSKICCAEFFFSPTHFDVKFHSLPDKMFNTENLCLAFSGSPSEKKTQKGFEKEQLAILFTVYISVFTVFLCSKEAVIVHSRGCTEPFTTVWLLCNFPSHGPLRQVCLCPSSQWSSSFAEWRIHSITTSL